MRPRKSPTPFLLVFAALLLTGTAGATEPTRDEDLRVQVQTDWAAQEKRAGREVGSVRAVLAAVERAGRLLENLSAMPDPPSILAEREA